MSFGDFLHRLGHAYPGKVPALAVRMDEKERVLQNKLNPNMETHHMNEDNIELMLDIIPDGNFLAAQFFARKGNGIVIHLIETGSSDMELLDCFIRAVNELGEFGAEFQRDFADGRITGREFERIVKESDEAIAAILELRERIGQMVEEKR